MRGRQDPQVSMLTFVDLETRIPLDHPLRIIKALADEALADLSPLFDAMYAELGRPSIPPERLLKALLLISLYSVLSEYAFCEELNYHLLFRWFWGWIRSSAASTRRRSRRTASACWSTRWRASASMRWSAALRSGTC